MDETVRLFVGRSLAGLVGFLFQPGKVGRTFGDSSAVAFRLLFGSFDGFVKFGQLFHTCFIGHLDDRGLVSATGLHARVGGVVEEGKELVVLLHRDGVVLVVVTLRALHRETHPDVGGGLDTVCDILDAEFFGEGASFIAGGVISVEAGGHLL